MNTILDAITTRLATVKFLKYAGENWGQLQYFGKECPVQWPCGLIDITGGQFTNIGSDYRQTPQNRQQGTVTVEITVANLRLSNNSARAPQIQKEAAYEIWSLAEDVHRVLQGWRPCEKTGGMVRTGMASVKRDDGVQEKRITYSLGLHDC